MVDSTGRAAPAVGRSPNLQLMDWRVAAALPTAELNLRPQPILTGCEIWQISAPSGFLLSTVGMWLPSYPVCQPGDPARCAELCPWLPVGVTMLAWFSSATLRCLAWLEQGQDLPLDMLEGANCWAKWSPGDSAGKPCSTQILFLKCSCYVFKWAPNSECRAEVHLALEHNIEVSLQGILFFIFKKCRTTTCGYWTQSCLWYINYINSN